jgi:hypothetical protein
MGAAARGVAQEEDEKQGVDEQDIFYLSLSRFRLAEPPTPRDTEASNAYAILHDARGPVCMCSLIGINSDELLKLCKGQAGEIQELRGARLHLGEP